LYEGMKTSKILFSSTGSRQGRTKLNTADFCGRVNIVYCRVGEREKLPLRSKKRKTYDRFWRLAKRCKKTCQTYHWCDLGDGCDEEINETLTTEN
jgi:hypothetical protein